MYYSGSSSLAMVSDSVFLFTVELAWNTGPYPSPVSLSRGSFSRFTALKCASLLSARLATTSGYNLLYEFPHQPALF